MVLFTPGEESADGYQGYLTNETLTGLYGQEIDGAVILIERKSHQHSRIGESRLSMTINRPILGRILAIR